MSTIRKISAEEFQTCQKSPTHCVVDVRQQNEFAAGSQASVCWPLSEINSESTREFIKQQSLSPDKTLVLLCARGMRAAQAAEILRHLIPNPIVIVEGGHAALTSAIGGKKTISIERQVRIAAGSLMLLGILGSVLIHPVGILLSAFVAAGLIFAGITDWCGLGLLMMKLPWNSVSKSSG